MSKEVAVRQQASMNQWALIIKEQRASGMTVRSFCNDRGLSWHAYYYWLRKIREALLDNNQPGSEQRTFVEMPCPNESAKSPVDGSIAMHIGAATLELRGNVSSSSLRTALQLIKELNL